MRNPLMKRVPRQIKENFGKYLGMFLILVCTILIGSSFLAVLEGANYTLKKVETDNKIEHGQFETVQKITEHTWDYFHDRNIKLVENFYETVNDFDGEAKLLIFNERVDMNIPSVFEGELPQKEGEIAMDRLFAVKHGLKVGDCVRINDKEYKLTALIALPDYTALFKSNSDLVMNPDAFGVSVVSKEEFDTFNDAELIFRYSYRYDKKPESDVAIREDVEDMQEEFMSQKTVVHSFLTDKANQSLNFIREDMGKDGPMIEVFIYILIAVIAFVFAVLTSNSIEAEAAIIGTLRATGYTRYEIIRHYLAPTVIIAVTSSVVGNLLGYTVMLKPFEDMYYTSYSMPPIQMQFSIKAFLMTTIVPVVIMIVLNFVMLYRKLSLTPLRFLRREIKKEKKGGAIRLPNFSFLNRYRIRVIWQNKGMYLILFTGIFLSSFLLMFGIGMTPLIEHYVDEIDDTLPYEYQYILKAPVENNVGEKMEVYELKAWYDMAGRNISISAMGIEKDSTIFDMVNLPDKKDEAVFTAPFAQKFNLKVGDTYVLKNNYYGKEYRIKVKEICDYNSSLGIFMRRDLLNELLEQDKETYNSYVSNEKLDIDEEYLTKYITRADLVGASKEMMKSFDVVIYMMNIFSVAIYMILMYILSKTVIEKNAIAISFLKVFGYNDKEINKVYLNATAIVVVVSLAICIPLEIVLFKLSLVYLSSLIEGYMEYYLPMYVYAMVIVIGIVAYFAINAFHVFKIRKIPMSIALKNRE